MRDIVLLPLDEGTDMLQSLASLSDDDVAAILGTVQKLCAGRKVGIESADGRRAMQIAVNYIESSGSGVGLLEKLISALKQTDQNGSSETKPSRVLLVEDDYILATELANALEDRGAIIVGPCATVEDATRQLDAREPTLVVVDINLGQGISFDLPRILMKRGLSFVFMTGYDRHVIPSEYSGVPFYQKPIDVDDFADKLMRLGVADCEGSSQPGM
ncbi:hypothetical protein JNB88_18055 [Rhizobium cauense]|uniref:response regulator n=1 Tax=Rhizobium cauense TaxID=1166683 RepID=UPI001C6DF125|nr:response regulator [Rhizobium cauense]MBW9115545.1 hypothetical protein [Rhizobium cauense]